MDSDRHLSKDIDGEEGVCSVYFLLLLRRSCTTYNVLYRPTEFRTAVLNYFIGLVSIYSTVQIASEIFIGRILRGKSISLFWFNWNVLSSADRNSLVMNIITPLFSVLYSPARSGHYSPTFAWLKIEMVEQEAPIGQYRSQMPLCTDTSLAELLLCNGEECSGRVALVPTLL